MKVGVILKLIKLLSFLGVIAMTIALLNGFIHGSFFEDGNVILNNPWGIVSLVDLYVGFMFFALWIAFREDSILYAILWIISLMILGFFIGALYVLITSYVSKNDWLVFFLGKKRSSSIVSVKTE